MKKLFVVLLLTAFLVSPVNAAQVLTEVLAETTLTNAVSSASATFYTGDTDKLTVFVEYSQTNSEAVSVEMSVSYNNDDWLNANFYDYTSGLAITTSEGISTSIWYYLYWVNDLSVPYVKVSVTGTGTWGATSTSAVTLYAVQDN